MREIDSTPRKSLIQNNNNEIHAHFSWNIFRWHFRCTIIRSISAILCKILNAYATSTTNKSKFQKKKKELRVSIEIFSRMPMAGKIIITIWCYMVGVVG